MAASGRELVGSWRRCAPPSPLPRERFEPTQQACRFPVESQRRIEHFVRLQAALWVNIDLLEGILLLEFLHIVEPEGLRRQTAAAEVGHVPGTDLDQCRS